MPYKWSWSDHHWTVRPMGWFSKYFVRRLGSTELTFPCADRCFTSKYSPLKRRFNGSSRIIPRGPQLVHIGIWHKYIKNALEEVLFQNYTSQYARGDDSTIKFDGCITPNITIPTPDQPTLPLSPTVSKCLIRFPEPTCGGLRQVQPLIQLLEEALRTEKLPSQTQIATGKCWP